MAAETEAYWWRGVAWLDWVEEIGVVQRPTEDAAMRRLAFQTVKAMDHLAKVHDFIFRDHVPDFMFRRAVREVLYEAAGLTPPPHRMTLREIHARRGIQLEWRTEVTKRGNVFTEVVEVEIPKAA